MKTKDKKELKRPEIRNIQVKVSTHKKLMKLKREQEKYCGDRVSLDEIISDFIN